MFAFASAIAGFLIWHFKAIITFRSEVHRLELRINNLEKNDEFQGLLLKNMQEVIFKFL